MEQSTLARDKISQAYLGLWGGEATQERAKNRIDWLAVTARGPKILDIGCSEGILPILLGREGYQVLGIDVNPDALSYAQELLEKETETVKNNVLFQQENILAANDFEEVFDTVIIAEVIEHFFHPHKAVQKAVQRLKSDGRLLLTTPFGYFPDPDHHQTFTLTDVVDIIKKHCFLEHISVVEGYIRVIGKKQDSGNISEGITSTINIIQLTEKAAIDAQKLLYASHNTTVTIKNREILEENQKNQELNERNRELYKQNQELNEKNRELYKQNQELNERNRELYKQNQELNERNRELYKQNQELNEKNREIYNEDLQVKKDIADKNKAIATLKETLSKTKQQLTQTINKKQFLTLKIKALKESEAWKIGYVTIKAFKEPGKNTLLWFPRLAKILLARARKHSVQGATSSNASKTSQCVSKKTKSVKKKQQVKKPEQIQKELSIAGLHTIAQQSELRIFTVLDDFSRLCFKPECNLIQPRPDNWQALAEYWHPNILFVESAWQGNEGSWQYRIGKYASPPGQELQEMIAWFKSQGIPTFFWNKEDPVHYDKFIDAAKQFDIIYTSDANRIPAYKEDTNIDRVFSLSFAAQPQLHNPISTGQPREPKVCFAGSFYSNRFFERQKEMEWLLDAAQEFGLDIYDRNFGLIGPDTDHFKFPERFHKNIIGKLPYPALCQAYKEYKVFLNVNSVVDSPTMFSRRIYELLASGTPIVSTYSMGIENVFGNDLVWMVESEKEARNALESLLNDEHVWENRSIKGIRKVFSAHTYAHRLQEITTQTDLQLPLENITQDQHIFLAAQVTDQKETDRLVKAFKRQTVQDYTLLLFSGSNTIPAPDNKNIELVQVDRKSQYLRDRLLASEARYFGTISSSSLYGKYYLEDLLNGFKYSNAAIIGKPSTGAEQYIYNSEIAPHGFLAQCSELIKLGGHVQKYLTLDPVKLSHLGLRCFCIDNMNYKQVLPNISNNDSLSISYDQIEL